MSDRFYLFGQIVNALLINKPDAHPSWIYEKARIFMLEYENRCKDKDRYYLNEGE